MNICRFCGAELPENAEACPSCGKNLTAPKKSFREYLPLIFCCVLGVLLIAGGLLPYLCSGDYEEYTEYLAEVYADCSSADEITAVAALRQYANLLTPLFYAGSSLLAFYTGLLAFKKKIRVTATAITCIVVHGLSILFSVFTNCFLFLATDTALSIRPSELVSVREILKETPDVLYYYQDAALCRLVISVLVIALSVALIFAKRRVETSEKKVSCYGNVMMIGAFSLIAYIILCPLLNNLFYGRFGEITMSSAGSAMDAFNRAHLSDAFVILCMLLLAASVLLNMVKRWMVAIPAVVVSAVLVPIGMSLAREALMEMDISHEILEYASQNCTGMLLDCAFLLIAVFFWFSSVSKGRIPLWLQVVYPLLLPALYAFLELYATVLLVLSRRISLSGFLIALITVLLSVLVRPGRKKEAQ